MDGVEVFKPDYDRQAIEVYEGEVVVIIGMDDLPGKGDKPTPAEGGVALTTGLPIEFVQALMDVYMEECASVARRRRAATRGVK